MKTKPICKDCGSDDLVFDGPTRWDVDTQSWVIQDVYDDVTCNACGRTSKAAAWVPVNAITEA